MKKLKLFAVLLLGVFIILQSCEKKEVKPEKELSKLEYLKQLTGNDNFIKSSDKNNDVIADSLNAVAYKYYPDENDMSSFQNIIIKDGKVENEDDIVTGWWITIESIGTLSAMGSGSRLSLFCNATPTNCAIITLFGNEHIMF